MAKKRAGYDFSTFTADDIVNAWEKTAKKALGARFKFHPDITNPTGTIIKRLKRSAARQLKKQPFNAAAYRDSTAVATALGKICAIMAAATKDKVVQRDVFERARRLVRLHSACPDPTAGSGPWCD